MRTRLIFSIVALLGTAACGGEAAVQEPPPNPNRARILAAVPVMPGAALTDTTGTREAERASYRVNVPFDSVARFFRSTMPAAGWLVLNDYGDSTVMDLYLRKDSATVWIHAQPAGLAATEFTLLSSMKGSEPPGDTIQ